MRRLLTLIALIALTGMLSFGSLVASAQESPLAGRWQITIVFANAREHKIQFDALGSGAGTLLLLDEVSNLNPPASLNKAEWKGETSAQFALSGDVEFPIGNVGVDAGTLHFEGTVNTPDSISGTVTFTRKVSGQITQQGSFTADRTPVPTLRMLSLNKGKKVKRGRVVNIEWKFEGASPVKKQQVSLSLDGGETFVPLSPIIEDGSNSYEWIVGPTQAKTRLALVRITVIDQTSAVTFDVCDKTFRIK